MNLPHHRRAKASRASAAGLGARPEPEPFSLPHWDDSLRAPGPLLMMLEARAPWEYAAMLVATPWLARLPVGDGHPVLVFPGLGASDITTAPLRKFLQQRGYTAYPWKQGFNFGPRHGVLDACRAQLKHLAAKHREPVSLIGWSLGGVYARELAKEQPEHTRCVITLGTPFAGHPRATNAWRFYEMVSGQAVHDHELLAQLHEPPPCPTTSLYSRSDGVVAWQCSLNPEAPHTENIEVHASHVGMGMNPLALYAIADRLAQDPQRWQKFDVQGARRWFFKTTQHAPMPASHPSAQAMPSRRRGAG
jgi:pimeloyl-ACP methyl ester carboxylesterase